eukprot:g81682.t1
MGITEALGFGCRFAITACNIGMLPVALEDLLFCMMPTRVGPDSKPLGCGVASEFLILHLRLRIVLVSVTSGACANL